MHGTQAWRSQQSRSKTMLICPENLFGVYTTWVVVFLFLLSFLCSPGQQTAAS